MKTKRHALGLGAALLALASGNALAAEHEVKMLNKGADGNFIFEPGYLKAAKGDTVKFVPVDMTHQPQSEVAPAGVAWKGEMNKPFTVTLASEGVYVYSCLPHKTMGMVGVIQAGAPVNLAAAKEAAAGIKIAQNKDRLDKYLAQVK
ncbi:MAG: pseudoazurin [Pseudomonadota bacterium]